MDHFTQLQQKQDSICVVGLGYVGLPLALHLSKQFNVIGFDVNEKKLADLEQGIDRTGEVDGKAVLDSGIMITSRPEDIADASFIIVAVPTPIDSNKAPDLTIIKAATQTVGQHMKEGAIVVYESTVYPGLTQEICIPILEEASKMTCGKEFSVGYSPERVNPGDKKHTIDKVTKIVSGFDAKTLETVSKVYSQLTTVYEAPSIKVAEATKIVENVQRDLNIALVNELAMLCKKMDISVYDVLEAAGTKWNFMKYKPGLVGGHCIGVDPYYLTFKAEALGHRPEIILAGRGINDRMHAFIAHEIIKHMVKMGKTVAESTFVILGITFKENVPDVRNSKVAELYQELKSFGITPHVYDPVADPEEVKHEYGIELTQKEDLPKADTLIVAVAHDEFAQLTAQDISDRVTDEKTLVVDFKKLFNKTDIEAEGSEYWTL